MSENLREINNRDNASKKSIYNFFFGHVSYRVESAMSRINCTCQEMEKKTSWKYPAFPVFPFSQLHYQTICRSGKLRMTGKQKKSTFLSAKTALTCRKKINLEIKSGNCSKNPLFATKPTHFYRVWGSSTLIAIWAPPRACSPPRSPHASVTRIIYARPPFFFTIRFIRSDSISGFQRCISLLSEQGHVKFSPFSCANFSATSVPVRNIPYLS